MVPPKLCEIEDVEFLKMNDPISATKNLTGTTLPSDASAWPEQSRIPSNEIEPATNFSLRHFRNQAEKSAINQALQHTGWNRKRAARLLSISYRSLLYKIRRHNISRSTNEV
jgi:transcriptional regulator with GAF, ATPase, and Fis domain